MNTQEYNGYSNFETWQVCNWIRNDLKTYQMFKPQFGMQIAVIAVKQIACENFELFEPEVNVFNKNINWQQVADFINSL